MKCRNLSSANRLPKRRICNLEIASETHRRLMRRLRKIVFAKKGKQISVSASAQLADFPD